MGLDTSETILLWGFCIALFYFFIVVPVGLFAEKATYEIISWFTPQVIFYLEVISLVLIGLFLIYLYTRMVLRIKENLEEKNNYRSRVDHLGSRIGKVLELKLEDLDYAHLKSYSSETRYLYDCSIEYDELSIFTSNLKEILIKTKRAIEKEEHKIQIRELDAERRRGERELEEIDKRIFLKKLAEDNSRRMLLETLNVYDHPVFPKDSLNEKQIVALLEDKYSKVNEYCIIDKKLKTFLIKPSSNHSKTHTFLVWNVVELLKRMDGVTMIREHESVDADITFKYKSKIYALEIETGTLLGKKKQTKDKIDFLNMKYPSRWFFIVSNKTLLPKYSSFGPATQRNGVLEKLQKLLK